MPTTEQLANVPHPAGATKVHEWLNPDDLIGDPLTTVGPDTARYFVGSSWIVNRDDSGRDLNVMIDGEQWPTGVVERTIFVNDANLTIEQARQLAAALIAAADEIRAMSSYDRMSA